MVEGEAKLTGEQRGRGSRVQDRSSIFGEGAPITSPVQNGHPANLEKPSAARNRPPRDFKAVLSS